MVVPIVVVGGEGRDSRFEISGHIIGDLVTVPLDDLVITLQLAVGLRALLLGSRDEATSVSRSALSVGFIC